MCLTSVQCQPSILFGSSWVSTRQNPSNVDCRAHCACNSAGSLCRYCCYRYVNPLFLSWGCGREDSTYHSGALEICSPPPSPAPPPSPSPTPPPQPPPPFSPDAGCAFNQCTYWKDVQFSRQISSSSGCDDWCECVIPGYFCRYCCGLVHGLCHRSEQTYYAGTAAVYCSSPAPPGSPPSPSPSPSPPPAAPPPEQPSPLPPSRPSPSSPSNIVFQNGLGYAIGCSSGCAFSNDGSCDDGGPGSDYSTCTPGEDCEDCGSRTYRCLTSCGSNGDGRCQDGGPDTASASCVFGTDCSDCGYRYLGQYSGSSTPLLQAYPPASPFTRSPPPPPLPPYEPNSKVSPWAGISDKLQVEIIIGACSSVASVLIGLAARYVLNKKQSKVTAAATNSTSGGA